MNPSPLRSPARHSKSRTQSSRTNNMQLPGLPRFHPANYPSSSSSDSSTSTTPYSTPPLDNLVSPRQQHRQYADPHPSQRHMYLYPRHGPSPLSEYPPTKLRSRPNSPRLNPLGSPGPVTPFELDEGLGYLSIRTASQKSMAELAEKMLGMEDDDEDDDGREDVRVQVAAAEGAVLGRTRPVSRPGTPARV